MTKVQGRIWCTSIRFFFFFIWATTTGVISLCEFNPTAEKFLPDYGLDPTSIQIASPWLLPVWAIISVWMAGPITITLLSVYTLCLISEYFYYLGYGVSQWSRLLADLYGKFWWTLNTVINQRIQVLKLQLKKFQKKIRHSKQVKTLQRLDRWDKKNDRTDRIWYSKHHNQQSRCCRYYSEN